MIARNSWCFNAFREALGKGDQCHKEELKDRVACQGDEGHVGFIQIIDRELPFCFLCFSGMILSSPVATMIVVAARNSQSFKYSHRLLARGSQCHRHDFKHRVVMPRRRQERWLYSDSTGRGNFFCFRGSITMLSRHGVCSGCKEYTGISIHPEGFGQGYSSGTAATSNTDWACQGDERNVSCTQIVATELATFCSLLFAARFSC